jgi:uncharacterized protein YutE (UPF0331/DUF86 family)
VTSSFAAADPSEAHPQADLALLDEEQVRDQVGAAEELLHLRHGHPALLAAGAAAESAMRLRARASAGDTASSGALLEALLADGAIDDLEYERLLRALVARDHLVHGFAPRDARTSTPERIQAVIDVTLRLLEGLPESADEPVARA